MQAHKLAASPPVEEQKPICESERVRVFDIPYSPLYRAEVKTPAGITEVFGAVRAYTKSVQVSDSGNITIVIDAKNLKNKVRAEYPHHYLHAGRVLCSLKRSRLTIADSFALNYNLFCVPWEMCITVHVEDGVPMAFIASRGEWERGQLNSYNREVQMFLPLRRTRHLALDLTKAMVEKGIKTWISHCEAELARKKG